MDRKRSFDLKRRAEAPWRNWYKLARWKALRAWQLNRHPLCAMCQSRGITRAANVVDHIRKHNGDPTLFWSPANLQSLDKACHDGFKQSHEKSGRTEIGIDGFPVE